MKAYRVSDLFFTEWHQLSGRAHSEVYSLHQQIKSLPADKQGSQEYGLLLIGILRRLRKRPLLVDKINVEQAVDIYNDLTFLNQPWYYFPQLQVKGLEIISPEEKLARHTFDHFIYADHEYSSFLLTQETKHLARLAATLYQQNFDKEMVDTIAAKLKVNEWKLSLIFYTYAQVREFVMKRCKTLLPPAPVSDNIKPTATGSTWLKLKHRLAETPAFQGYETAGRANMYASLDYLEDLAQQKENAHRH